MTTDGQAPGLRHNKPWRLLFIGQSVSVLGDFVFLVTVMLWIATRIGAGRPWAAAAVSGALIAEAAPAVLIGPVAGVWVDRWDRRRLMLTADAGRCVLILCLLALPALAHTIPAGAQLAVLYVVLAACSGFAEFFDPSRLAIIGAIVPPGDQPQASGLLQSSSALAQVIGPPIAAPLLITFGVQWAVILNAATFAASFLCVRAIRPPAEPARPDRESFAAEFRTGIRFFVRSKVLVALGVGAVIALLGTGALIALLAFFLPANLHASASWLGTVAGAVGVGAIAGALGSGAIAGKVGPGRLFCLGLLVCGVAVIALSRCSALWPAIVACVVIGLGVGTVNSMSGPIMLAAAPAYMIGRVNAVVSPLAQIAQVVSIAVAGVLASTALRDLHASVAGVTFGPYDTIYGVAGLLIVVAALATVGPMRTIAASHSAQTVASHSTRTPDLVD